MTPGLSVAWPNVDPSPGAPQYGGRPPSGGPTAPLDQALKPFVRRIRGQRAVEFASWAAGVLGAAAVLLLAASHAAYGAAAVVALVASVAAAWSLPVPLGRAARMADAHCGLHAAADTALHLQRQGHPAAEAVALDAVEGLAGKEPPGWKRPTGWWFALVFLLLAGGVGAVVDLEPEPAPAAEDDPMLAQLDAIEADARRKGQVELVEAVQDLRERVKAVRDASEAGPPEELIQKDEAPPEIVVPPPPPPVEPEAELPAEFASQEAYDRALDEARQTMLSDDEILAEFAGEIEDRLMEIAEFQDLGNQMFAETLRANEMASLSGGSMDMDLGGALDRGSSQSMNRAMEQVGQDAPGPVDPASTSGMRDLEETASQEHELGQALQQSYQDFLKAYADALRDELVEAIEEQHETADRGRDEGGDMSSQPTTGGGEKQDKIGQANLQIREQDSPATAARMGDIPDGGGKPLNMTGAGGGGEPEGGREGVSEEGQAGGAMDQLEGGFGPGNLSAEQRQQVLTEMSGKAVQTGPGSEFDDTWGGYFDEAERALVEDDMPPMMKGMVAAYFAGLQQEQR